MVPVVFDSPPTDPAMSHFYNRINELREKRRTLENVSLQTHKMSCVKEIGHHSVMESVNDAHEVTGLMSASAINSADKQRTSTSPSMPCLEASKSALYDATLLLQQENIAPHRGSRFDPPSRSSEEAPASEASCSSSRPSISQRLDSARMKASPICGRQNKIAFQEVEQLRTLNIEVGAAQFNGDELFTDKL